MSCKICKRKNNPSYSAISSKLAAEIYHLNILEEEINDQKGNTTRFFIIVEKDNKKFDNKIENKKVSLVFKVKDMPAVLYKCLGAFATRNINLTRIESLATKENRFEYMFWVDFIYPGEKILKDALDELAFFSKDIKILGIYNEFK